MVRLVAWYNVPKCHVNLSGAEAAAVLGQQLSTYQLFTRSIKPINHVFSVN